MYPDENQAKKKKKKLVSTEKISVLYRKDRKVLKTPNSS